jgi:hypothetical protein
MPRPAQPFDADAYRQMYVEFGMSTQAMAEHFGTTAMTIRARLKKLGVEMRQPAAPKLDVDPETVDYWYNRIRRSVTDAERERRRIDANIIEARTHNVPWSVIAKATGRSPQRLANEFGSERLAKEAKESPEEE